MTESVTKPDAQLEIIPLDQNVNLATADVKSVVKSIEDKARAILKIKVALLQLCPPDTIRDFGGRPYIEENGALWLLGPMQVEMTPPEVSHEKHDDGTYSYFVAGQARCNLLGTGWVPIVGSRWSGDRFFSAGSKPVDPGDILKAAYTSYRVRAIKDTTGLDGLSWDDIKAAGIKRDNVRAVEFDQSRQHAKQVDTGDDGPIREHIALTTAGSPDGSEALVKILQLKTAAGTSKAGKDWYKTSVHIDGEHGKEWMGTFDLKVGGVLLNAYEARCQVVLWFEKKGDFFNVLGAELVEADPS
jgi:hypothetical protein